MEQQLETAHNKQGKRLIMTRDRADALVGALWSVQVLQALQALEQEWYVGQVLTDGHINLSKLQASCSRLLGLIGVLFLVCYTIICVYIQMNKRFSLKFLSH